jgi:phospholipid/cholesterol/gamma-HCH transport system substrate-binding protein
MRDRHLLYGIAFLGVMGLLLSGTVALYRGSFTPTVHVVVAADRAGLTMDQGAAVKLRGVEVGKVTGVRTVPHGTELDVNLYRRYVDRIPAAVTAQIVPPTAFGNKYVQLTASEGASDDAIEAGAMIHADYVNVEVNDAFANLTRVLEAAPPSEVNNALTALSTAVDQRGERIGALITQVDRYLTSLTGNLPALSTDLRRADEVLGIYDAAAPDLLKTAKNASVTSTTLVRRQRALRSLSASLYAFSERADDVVNINDERLAMLLDLLDPVTAILAKYSPELPCVIKGVAYTNRLAEAAVGGTNPGVTTFTGIQPGDAPYTAPRNLPITGETRGPGCFGLPVVSPEAAMAPNPVMKTGANPYAHPQRSGAEEARDTFFGLLSGVVGGR